MTDESHPNRLELAGDWADVLKHEQSKPYWDQLQRSVAVERAEHDIYPASEHELAALDLTSFEEVRVVILGQDPYFKPGQANGLCFSVPHGITTPPSLRNIFKALGTEGITPPPDGDLAGWARQGVLLLNTTLTVRRGAPNSHQGLGWESFTDAVIRAVSDGKERVVFLLWGRAAQRKEQLIDTTRHVVLGSAHPAARSNALYPLGKTKSFSRANEALLEANQPPIDWSMAAAQKEVR